MSDVIVNDYSQYSLFYLLVSQHPFILGSVRCLTAALQKRSLSFKSDTWHGRGGGEEEGKVQMSDSRMHHRGPPHLGYLLGFSTYLET